MLVRLTGRRRLAARGLALVLTLGGAALVASACNDLLTPARPLKPVSVVDSAAPPPFAVTGPVAGDISGTYSIPWIGSDGLNYNYNIPIGTASNRLLYRVTLQGRFTRTSVKYGTTDWYGPAACAGGSNVGATNSSSLLFSCYGANDGPSVLVKYGLFGSSSSPTVYARRERAAQATGCDPNGTGYCFTFSEQTPATVTFYRVPAKLEVTPTYAAAKYNTKVRFEMKVQTVDPADAEATPIIPTTASSWWFTPDGGTAVQWNCSDICDQYVTKSGWLKAKKTVNGEPQEVNIRIVVYTSIRLDPPPAEYHVGDTVIFRPFLDGENAPASGWAFSFTGDSTLDCKPGDTACKQLMRSPGTGSMKAYITRGDGTRDSASTGVTVRSRISLTADPQSVLVGQNVLFTFYRDGQVAQPGGWRWKGPDPGEPADCSPTTTTCTQLARNPGVGIMTAYLGDPAAPEDSTWAWVAIGVDCETFAPTSARRAPAISRQPRGRAPVRPSLSMASLTTSRALEACQRTQPDTGGLPAPQPSPNPPLPPPPSDSTFYRLTIIDYGGVNIGANGLTLTGPSPASGDSLVRVIAYPQRANPKYSFTPRPRYKGVTLFGDSTLRATDVDSLSPFYVEMTRDRLVQVAATPDFNLDADIAAYRQRWRSLIAAPDKVEAYRQHLQWLASVAPDASANDDSVAAKLRIAFALEFDPIADASTLQQFDDQLHGHVFFIPAGASASGIEILRPAQYRGALAVRARPEPTALYSAPTKTAVIYINGVRNLESDVDRGVGVSGSNVARGPLAFLHLMVNNNADLPGAFPAKFYNRTARAQLQDAGISPCAIRARWKADYVAPIVVLGRFAGCKGSYTALLIAQNDFSEAMDEISRLEIGGNADTPVDVNRLADTLAKFYHAENMHTIFVTHSQGNLVLAQALKALPSIEGKELQTGQCTAHISFASPVAKAFFGSTPESSLWATGFQRGQIMNHDVLLLLLPGHNDFGPPWGESYVTRNATAAINAANWLAKPLVKLQWGVKTHEVVPNYFADAANSDLTRRWLKELFVQCRDGVH
jgi:hypothetical protein